MKLVHPQYALSHSPSTLSPEAEEIDVNANTNANETVIGSITNMPGVNGDPHSYNR